MIDLARMHARITERSLPLLGALAFALIAVPSAASAAVTAPNTVISNTATATYTDSQGVAQATTSNTVTTTVQNAPTMTLSSPSGQNVSVDEVVLTNTYTATNTGNASGNFTLPSDATFTGSGTLVGYVIAGTSCTNTAPCALSAANTALAGLSASAINGTLALQVQYTVNAGATAGSTIAVNFNVAITYPTSGAAASTTSATMTSTETDTVLADARLDLQASATIPGSGGASIVWTVTANNGGSFPAHDLKSVKTWFGSAANGIAIFDKVPTFGGSALTISATSVTLGTVTSGAAYTLYYSTATTPATSSDWTTGSLVTNAKWVAVVLSGGSGGIELPSAPSGSTAGAGAVTTAQITLTITTAQPSGTGAGNTNSVTDMANSVIGGNPGATSVTPANGQGITIGTADTTSLSLSGIETNATSSSGTVYPGGASNSCGSHAYSSYSVANGPLNNPSVTGSYPAAPNNGAATADNNKDFTVLSFACANGNAVNDGSTLCTVAGGGVSFPQTLENTGNSADTFNITATPPAGWKAQIFSVSSCPTPTTTVPTCSGLSAISALSTSAGAATTTTSAISVGSLASYTYVVTYTAASGVTPFVTADAVVTAAGVTGGGTGQDTNDTHDDVYPGGVIKLTKSFTITSNNCPAGASPSAPANTVCPGGVIQYAIAYADVAPAAMTSNIGGEPAWAYAATSNQAGTLAITDDGAISTNNWATYTFGLNAAPSDSLNGTNTTYVYSGASGFASGTYPSMTAGYSKFVATVGGSSFQCVPGTSGTITYNVTVK